MLGKTIGTVGGLALGLALTKKLAKNPSAYKLALGGGTGAGLGFMAGKVIDDNSPFLTIPTDDPVVNKTKFRELAKDRRTGEPTEPELALYSSGWNTDPSTKKGIEQVQAANYSAGQVSGIHNQRAAEQDYWYKKTGDEDFKKAAEENRRLSKDKSPKRALFSPYLLKDILSGMR